MIPRLHVAVDVASRTWKSTATGCDDGGGSLVLAKFLGAVLDYGVHALLVIYIGLAAVWARSDASIDERMSWVLAITGLVGATILVQRFRTLRKLEYSIEDLRKTVDPPSAAEALLRTGIPDLKEQLTRSNAIDVCGLLLSEFAVRYDYVVKGRLESGATIRCLIIDPKSEAASQARARYSTGQTDSDFQADVKTVSNRLDRWGRTKTGSVEVRLLPYVPSYGMRLLDRSSPDAELWVEVFSFRSEIDAAFRLTRADQKWFEFFVEEFDRMWRDATSRELPIDMSENASGMNVDR